MLGQCWDGERPTLSLAWRGQGGGAGGGWGVFLIFPPCPSEQERQSPIE